MILQSDDNTGGLLYMNKTYRYFNGETDITDSFTGKARPEAGTNGGKWLLELSQGGK